MIPHSESVTRPDRAESVFFGLDRVVRAQNDLPQAVRSHPVRYVKHVPAFVAERDVDRPIHPERMHLFGPAENEGSERDNLGASQQAASACGRSLGPPNDGSHELTGTFDNASHWAVGCGRYGDEPVTRTTARR